jgi:hypothetical protein
MLRAARYLRPSRRAAHSWTDTSSTLRTMGNLRGSMRNCMYFFISSRPHVIEKSN